MPRYTNTTTVSAGEIREQVTYVVCRVWSPRGTTLRVSRTWGQDVVANLKVANSPSAASHF